jgi:hypothetical protein
MVLHSMLQTNENCAVATEHTALGILPAMPDSVHIQAIIERKDPRLPRFAVVPTTLIAHWKLQATTVVEASANGHALGRRTIKMWDEARWFVELTEPMCRQASIDTGEQILLELRLASTALPEELAALLQENNVAQRAWESLTPGNRRMVGEMVAQAKQSATRRRRAAKALGIKIR